MRQAWDIGRESFDFLQKFEIFYGTIFYSILIFSRMAKDIAEIFSPYILSMMGYLLITTIVPITVQW